MDGVPEQSSGGANSAPPSGGATTNPILWTDELHADFCQAIERCGGPLVARPKNIKANMRSDSVTTTQIKSHLQRHRQRLLATSVTESPAAAATTGSLPSSGNLAARPQALPGWYSPGEEAGPLQAFKRPRPAPQLTSSLATFQAMFAQQQQQQQQQFDPLVMQAMLVQQHGEAAASPFYQQQQQQQLARPAAMSALQWGPPAWGHSPMATSQLPHMQRAPAAGLGAGAGLLPGADSLGRMAASESPGTHPAMGMHPCQHQHSHQHAHALAAAPAFAAWLGALLSEAQGMGGVPPASGSGVGATAPTLAALAAASGGSGASGAAPQAGREERATVEVKLPGVAQGDDAADDGSSTMTLLHQMALLAAQQCDVQQEIGEHMQALHGLHAKLDSLAAQMLEYISRHYAQFGRHPRAQPTPGPSVQAEGPQQQPEQEQQQRRRRPEQQQQLHQQHKPPQRSPAARQLPLDELAGSVVRADD